MSHPAPSAPAPSGVACLGAEQRTTPRIALLIRAAKLIGGPGEFLCIVRDASATGLKLRVFHRLPEREPLAIELADGEPHAIEKVWQDGAFAGVRFIAPVPLERLLAEAPAGLRKRAVRLRLGLPGRLVWAGQHRPIRITDISQQGAGIESFEHLAIGERVVLDCPCLPPLAARVRWRRRPFYGLILEQTFRFDELARLTAALHGDPSSGPVRAELTVR